MKKRLLSLLCVVCLLLTALPTGAFAVEGEETLPAGQAAEGGETKEKTPPDDRTDGEDGGQAPLVGAMTVTEFVTLDPDELDGISDAELLEGYLYSVSGLYGGASLFRAPARPLPGAMPTVYAEIVPMIQKIAEGNASLTSTKFQFSWTKSMADWGIISDPTTEEEINAAANEILNKNFSAAQVSALIQRLLSTMPYELYWFDKSKGGYSMVCNGSGGKDNFAVNLTISMAISAEYATSATENVTINGVQTACHYVPDTTKTGAATNAVAVAEGVVSKNATKSDYDKLVAYLEYIKNAVSYNTAAANSLKPGEAPHPNDSPWQLIDVFHGTGTPNHKQVVCEGYAKAFQYPRGAAMAACQRDIPWPSFSI